MRLYLVAFLAISSLRAAAQRVWAIVPLVGSGHGAADPKRPMFAPRPGDPTNTRTGIIAYSFQPSDDGRFALVEFVARDRAAFRQILADRAVTSFLRGAHGRAQVETEFRRFKKDFNIEQFRTAVR